jgi:integrase
VTKKRRGKGEGSLYLRGDGYWVAELNVPHQGRRQRVVRSAKTRQAANRKLQKAKAELERSVLVSSSATVEQWLRYWRDEIASERIRPSTLAGYNTYIEQHLIPRIGKHRLDKLEAAHVRRLYADMRRPCPDPDLAGNCPHKPSHGRAEASIRQTHAILSRALKVAVREGKVARNVCENLDPPATTKNPRTPLTVHQARAVLAAAENDPLESRWYAALWLGLRQGEALGLGWQDVNLDEGLIWINRALQRVKGKGLVFVEPKSRLSNRPIPVMPLVLARLRVHWAVHVNAGGARDALVWSNDGKPIDPAKDYKAWGALLRKAGVPYVALHAARNTAASLLDQSGATPKTIMEILGQGTIEVSQTHYIQSDIAQRREAMLALERYAT